MNIIYQDVSFEELTTTEPPTRVVDIKSLSKIYTDGKWTTCKSNSASIEFIRLHAHSLKGLRDREASIINEGFDMELTPENSKVNVLVLMGETNYRDTDFYKAIGIYLEKD